MLQQEDIEGATKSWIETVVSLCDRHAPEKDVSIKPKTEMVPWFDENVHALMSAKTRALQKLRRYGTRKCKQVVKNISNKLKNYKRKLKRQYFGEKIRGAGGKF